ncbi:MAG: hypothetical protein ACYDEJ_14100 [Desulfitobacteriaceae bacterium]
MCTAVWPRSADVEDLPSEPVKTAVIAEIKANPIEALPIILSADDNSEVFAESESPEIEAITAEEKTEPMPPTEPLSETGQYHRQLSNR